MISDFGFRISDFKRAVLLLLLLSAFCLLPSAFAQVHPHSFSPRQLPSLLWLRADAITGVADGGSISTWPDSGAQVNDAVQDGAVPPPLWRANQVNGRPVVAFNGDTTNGNWLKITTESGFRFTAEFWAFIVLRLPVQNGTGYRAVFGKYAMTPSGWDLGGYTQDSLPGQIRMTIRGTSNINNGAAGNDYRPNAFQATIRSWNGGITIWENGGLIGTIAGTWTPTTNTIPVYIGNREASTATQLLGDIAELLVRPIAMSDRDRQRVERYLARKWGL